MSHGVRDFRTEAMVAHSEVQRLQAEVAELRRERDLARGQSETYREMLDAWYEDGRKLGREEGERITAEKIALWMEASAVVHHRAGDAATQRPVKVREWQAAGLLREEAAVLRKLLPLQRKEKTSEPAA